MIRVVTTCNAEGWRETGEQMVDTFSRFWPETVRLILYAEGFTYWPKSSNVEIRELPKWHPVWKASLDGVKDAHGRDRSRNRRGVAYDFRRDCVKFSHKIAALTDAGLACNDDLLIWADADTLTHALVDEQWLRGLIADGSYMAWLARPGTYPECGFMIFRCDHVVHKPFMTELLDVYRSGAVLNISETHDSFVIKHIVDAWVSGGNMDQPHSIFGRRNSGLYVFHYSLLGERLDHAKGPRKQFGRTPKEEISGRSEAHWT